MTVYSQYAKNDTLIASCKKQFTAGTMPKEMEFHMKRLAELKTELNLYIKELFVTSDTTLEETEAMIHFTNTS